MWGRELLANGSLPRGNPYSYSAPGFLWLRHEWLSEVAMASMYDRFGPFGLKLIKFVCTALTICFVATAESETGAPATLQAAILLMIALILAPVMQFRPQLFDFVALSAIIAMLARHSWRGSAPLWLAIPLVAIWSNFHGGFFVGIVVMGVYGAATVTSDIAAGRGPRRGLGIIAITAAAAASTLCTFLIPPARDTWYTLIHEILNPMTHYAMTDWEPLLTALTNAPGGSVEQKYFIVTIFFFAAAIVSVILTPKGADAPMIAVAAVMLATAFTAVRNIPLAAIAVAPFCESPWIADTPARSPWRTRCERSSSAAKGQTGHGNPHRSRGDWVRAIQWNSEARHRRLRQSYRRRQLHELARHDGKRARRLRVG